MYMHSVYRFFRFTFTRKNQICSSVLLQSSSISTREKKNNHSWRHHIIPMHLFCTEILVVMIYSDLEPGEPGVTRFLTSCYLMAIILPLSLAHCRLSFFFLTKKKKKCRISKSKQQLAWSLFSLFFFKKKRVCCFPAPLIVSQVPTAHFAVAFCTITPSFV